MPPPPSNPGPSVADLGCLSRTPDPNFFPSRIQGQKDPGSTSKNLRPKVIVSKLPEIWSGMFIPDPDVIFYPSRIRNLGVKKAPDPGSGSATLLGPIPMGVVHLARHREEDIRRGLL
jgi:hypothetical protein